MQTLYFEEAWDRTVSKIDREKIINHFTATELSNEVWISFLWESTNYKNEKLITALIHNPKVTPFEIHQTPIAFVLSNGLLKINLFHIPLCIPAKTSMPWTFIFSDDDQTARKPEYIIHQSKLYPLRFKRSKQCQMKLQTEPMKLRS